MRNPPAFAHVGLTVPSLDAAVAWYRDVLGLDPLVPSLDVTEGVGHAGRAAADALGTGFGRVRQAHLATANGVALELFEFADDRALGCSHFCLTDRDVEGTAARVARAGGRLRSRVWETAPGSGFRFCHCEDPFGNALELHSHSPERVYGGVTVSRRSRD